MKNPQHDNYLQHVAARLAAVEDSPARRGTDDQASPNTPAQAQRRPLPIVALTFEEVAEMMGVSLRTLRRWPIPFFEEGGVRRIRLVDLEAFIAARVKNPPAAERGTLDTPATPTGDN